ncbi:MAG: hypothetical protein WCQ54_11515 [Clostridiaceae bacterium]
MFDKKRKEAWMEFAEEVNGEYTSASFFKTERIRILKENYMVLLDLYTVSTGKSVIFYTRFKAVYHQASDFKFKVYKRGIFSNLGKKLGMQDINTGNGEFDEDFIVKGNDESNIIRLFSNVKTRDLLYKIPSFTLEIKNNKEAKELCLMTPQIIKERDKLRDAFQLFCTVLDDIGNMGIVKNYEIEDEKFYK